MYVLSLATILRGRLRFTLFHFHHRTQIVHNWKQISKFIRELWITTNWNMIEHWMCFTNICQIKTLYRFSFWWELFFFKSKMIIRTFWNRNEGNINQRSDNGINFESLDYEKMFGSLAAYTLFWPSFKYA